MREPTIDEAIKYLKSWLVNLGPNDIAHGCQWPGVYALSICALEKMKEQEEEIMKYYTDPDTGIRIGYNTNDPASMSFIEAFQEVDKERKHKRKGILDLILFRKLWKVING